MNEHTPQIVPEPASTADEPRGPLIHSGLGRALLFFLAFIAFQVVWGVVAVLSLGLAGAAELTVGFESTSGALVLVGSMVGPVLLAFLFVRLLNRQPIRSLGFSFDTGARRDFLAGLAWGAVLIAAAFFILLAAGVIHVVSVQFPVVSFVSYLAFFALVALNEEVVIRGYVQGNLMGSMNKYLALIFSSVLFAALHIFNANLSLLGIANIILAGLLLGMYYIHKKNLWFPIGVHWTWNFFQGVVFGAAVSGNNTESVLTISMTGSDLVTGGEFGFEGSVVTTILTVVSIVAIHLLYRSRAAGSSAGPAIEPVEE
ncbi:MAG: CPBP family intramembrane metalloprotease [candidate division Zixibacteria bacterium]|nr:CPBP family intramembrane metalloprotease [candidate division Zixibacteria bacterium]